MMKALHNPSVLVLLAGDIITLGLVTIWGFASHNTLGTAGARLLTTFLPLVAGWLLVGPFVGVFDPQRAADMRQVWRPFWAMIMAAPMSMFLRAAWLGSPISPLLVVILGGISALALLAWRLIYAWFASRKTASYG